MVFLQKVRNFINAFGSKYNDPSVVDYIDANGMALWGEGNGVNFDSSQPNNNRDWVFRTIATYYRAAFPNVLLGVQNSNENDAVTVNITRQITDIYRRDSFGATQWLSESNKAFFASEVATAIPVFAENAWNAFNPIIKPTYYKDWGFDSPEGMIKADYRDVKMSRANNSDLRIPSDAVLWMKTNYVDSLVNNMGYRFVPSNLYIDNSISENGSLRFYSTWTNTGWGCFPNGRPAWNHKYKLAFALLNQENSVMKSFVSDAKLEEVFKGGLYHYQAAGLVNDLESGTYKLAYAIVDSLQQYQPAIALAINDARTSTGWYTFDQITITKSANGISQTEIQKSPLTCSPKPVNKKLTISSEIPFKSIQLIDMQGAIIASHRLTASGQSTYQLDMESYASGNYVIVLKGIDSKTYTAKIIKK